MPSPLPSDADLLWEIAASESLDRVLAAFPGLTRTTLGQRLEALAATLAPETRPVSAALARTATRDFATLRLYSDGAARGNPGPAGAGAVLVTPEGVTVEQLGKFLGRQTNNVAEYEGVLLGLRRARELGVRSLEVYADSQLMIRQLDGSYKVKNEGLKPLHAEASAMLKGFAKVKLVHIPREENRAADEMSNRAIDERM